jgi:HYR domain-containing protein
MRARKRTLIIATSVTCVALLSGAAAAGNGSDGSNSVLNVTMQVTIADNYRACPPGTPAKATGCFSRKGVAAVRGLGRVEESWDPVVDEIPASCGSASLRFLPSTARFTVSGKGAIDVQVNGSKCLAFNPPSPVEGAETFTVTGGSGRFAGASGAGTIDHFSNGPGLPGRDTWRGTLAVPGIEFDLTPPTITGAADKRVRAPRNTQRIRVRYHVSARDDVDGAVPVACRPKSGSFFPVGRRTVVRCSATDTSANTQTAQFAITIRPRSGA